MKFKNVQPLSQRLARNLWRLVSHIPFNYLPHYSGNFIRRFLLRLFGSKLGKGVVVNNKVKIYNPKNIFLADNVSIGPGVLLYSVDEIWIGKNTVISQNAELITASHDYTTSEFLLRTKPIKIGDFCWIAQGACILPGVTLSNNVVCSAHSVVSKSVNKPGSVIGGNHAVYIKDFSFIDLT